ncbi:MAG: 50S ribosomal protein L22 [bacterium]|nr:50S ribosomal protein L22 [bacterium]
MKAILNNHRQSPRKVRLVADMVRGKKVADALQILSFGGKVACDPINKLLKSAIANSGKEKGEISEFFVKDITVNGGTVLRRTAPRARGSANVIKKRTSNITLVLDTKPK